LPTAVPTTGSARGSGRATGPIKIGFLVTDYRTFRGSQGGESGPDPQKPFRELVGYLNAHGGLGGRKVIADHYSLDANSTNTTTSQAAQQSCAHFTQDKKDEIVISQEWFHPTLETCLGKARVPHFDAGISFNVDGRTQDELPYYFNPTTIGVDRYAVKQLENAVAKGWVKAGDKLGVFVMDCPAYTRVYDNVVRPAAARLKVELLRQTIQCNNGTADLGPTVSQIQSSVLRFQSNGVKALMAVSPAESVGWLFFSIQAEQQHYRPTYLVTSNAYPDSMVKSSTEASGFPAGQLAGVHGIGWVPTADLGVTAPAANATQEQQRAFCLKASRDAGGSRTASASAASGLLATYFEACDTLVAVGALLRATSGVTSLGALDAAYARALPTAASASNASGRIQPPPYRHDAVADVRPFQYNGSCTCIQYVGSSSPVG
jgi:hypothetical protein